MQVLIRKRADTEAEMKDAFMVSMHMGVMEIEVLEGGTQQAASMWREGWTTHGLNDGKGGWVRPADGDAFLEVLGRSYGGMMMSSALVE